MIKPPFARAEPPSHDSLPASCEPEVRARDVSDPMIATTTDSNTRLVWYETTIGFPPRRKTQDAPMQAMPEFSFLA